MKQCREAVSGNLCGFAQRKWVVETLPLSLIKCIIMIIYSFKNVDTIFVLLPHACFKLCVMNSWSSFISKPADQAEDFRHAREFFLSSPTVWFFKPTQIYCLCFWDSEVSWTTVFQSAFSLLCVMVCGGYGSTARILSCWWLMSWA